MLAYYVCHLYSRCARSVSHPNYYAHLLADRKHYNVLAQFRVLGWKWEALIDRGEEDQGGGGDGGGEAYILCHVFYVFLTFYWCYYYFHFLTFFHAYLRSNMFYYFY